MAKKQYPGGFKLTKKTAAELCVREFGTAKGLEKSTATDLEGFFSMRTGNMVVSINPDMGMSGCIEVRVGLCTASHTCVGYFNPETLEPDYDVMERYERRERDAALEQWVFDAGPEPCHKRIDKIWNREA